MTLHPGGGGGGGGAAGREVDDQQQHAISQTLEVKTVWATRIESSEEEAEEGGKEGEGRVGMIVYLAVRVLRQMIL